MPAPGPDPEPIGLDDLIRFYRRPVAWLLEQRLGLRLDEFQDPASQREPLELDGLDEYLLGQALLDAALEVDSPDWDRAQAIQRAAGRLPPGAAGEVLMQAMAGRIEPILQAARPLLEGPEQPPLCLDLDLGPEHLSGSLTDLRPQGQVVVSYGRLNAKRRLVGWLRHLALIAAAGSGQDRASVLIGRAKQGDPIERVSLGRLSQDPTALLADLVAIFRYGQSTPLRFFPNSSLAYAQAMAGKDPDDPVEVAKAMKKAYKEFRPGRSFRAPSGEGEHPAVRKALGDMDPIGAPAAAEGFAFGQLALRIWGPFLEAVAKGRAP